MTTMALPPPPQLTYQDLDHLSVQAAVVFVLYWKMRPTIPPTEWAALVVSVLVEFILQGETMGRAYGRIALPKDGRALVPTDNVPRRPAPEEFTQRGDLAPKPDKVIDHGAREAELTKRLSKAVATLAAEPGPTLERVERLGADEVVAGIQRGYQDGVRVEGKILGYRRGINPDCCELCFWLYKEGYVYPIDQPMHRHTGCRCVPVPTTDEIGKHSLNAEEQKVLGDLYDRYITNKGLEATA